jgi:hypothetical protein
MRMTGQSAKTIAGSPVLVKGDQLDESLPQRDHNGVEMLIAIGSDRSRSNYVNYQDITLRGLGLLNCLRSSGLRP